MTGASGFVGGHLVPALRASFPEAELVYPRVDITQRSAVVELVERTEPDACVHLAAISTIAAARLDPCRTWRTILHGTLYLAQAIMQAVPRCVFLFVSSADIYGASFRSGEPLDESALLAPTTTYGAAKAAADLAIGQLATEGLHAIRLRPFNHTGPGQSNRFVVAAFAEQVARIAENLQPPLLRIGALDTFRDFLDVRDVCAAYVACLARADEIEPGSIFNVASGVPRRIGDILTLLCELAGARPSIEIDSSRLRTNEIRSVIGSAERITGKLGWQVRYPWQQTLHDMLADWRVRVHAGPT